MWRQLVVGRIVGGFQRQSAVRAKVTKKMLKKKLPEPYAPPPGPPEPKEVDPMNRPVTSSLDSILQSTKVDAALSDKKSNVPSGTNLMYQGTWVDNWEELLREARQSYPWREGPRRTRYKKRMLAREKVQRRQHYQTKLELIAAHHREQLEKKRRAIARIGWEGPTLAS